MIFIFSPHFHISIMKAKFHPLNLCFQKLNKYVILLQNIIIILISYRM